MDSHRFSSTRLSAPRIAQHDAPPNRQRSDGHARLTSVPVHPGRDHLADSENNGVAGDQTRLDDALRRYQQRRDRRALATILNECEWLALACARRLQRRGESLDDLEQVAREAIIGAAARFDFDRGIAFKSFAWATAAGALRHHYRGRWQVRVPRGLQETHLAVVRASGELTSRFGREPTVAEIAVHSNLDRDEVILGLDVSHAYLADSIDYRQGDDRDSVLARSLGTLHDDLESVPEHVTLRDALDRLSSPHRRVITSYFFEGRTQSEIGDELGVSQAQVSRLMRSALGELRRALEVPAPTPADSGELPAAASA